MKWFAYSVLAIFLLVQFAPTVQAEAEDDTNSIIEINFQPYRTDNNSTIVNMADETTMRYEQDKIFAALPGVEGKYHGPYLESSLFQFEHEGGYFFFHTNFTIGPDVIMNGVSTFWVRIPVIPSQFEAWHVFCDWGYYNNLEGIQMGGRDFGVMLLPWEDHDTWYGWDYNMGSGNVWSTDAGDTYQIRQASTGLYVEFKGIFEPDDEFTLAFWGVLRDGQKPKTYLTQERIDPTKEQIFRFYEPYELRSDAGVLLDYGYKYDNNISMALEPAWAFLFTSGLGKEGMTSYNLKFRDSANDFIRWGTRDMGGTVWPYPVDGFENDTYLSFYMPFSAVCTSEEMGTTIISNSIDWFVSIRLNMADIYNPAVNYFAEFNRSSVGLGHLEYLEFSISNTNNYLLFSTPYPISINWTEVGPPAGPPPYTIDVTIILIPLQKCDIVLLGNSINEDDAFWGTYDVPYGHDLTYPWEKVGVFTEYYHEDERASWDSTLRVNAHWLPLYHSIAWTDGRWAEVNETKLYWTYDFGWGMAYSFPGETQLYMFLDDGGRYFYNGSYVEIVAQLAEGDKSWWEELFQDLVDILGYVAGWIWDGIVQVWDTLVSVGNWIYTTVSKIVQWLISVVKDIAGKVSDIIEGILYGFPMLVILFCATYYGEMLYKGKLPRMSKERRLFRKVVKKPIKRVVRVVKKEYKGYVTTRTKRIAASDQQRAADYRQQLRLERQREKWRIGEGEYEKRQEAVKRGQSVQRKGVSYGKYDEKTRRGKRTRRR